METKNENKKENKGTKSKLTVLKSENTKRRMELRRNWGEEGRKGKKKEREPPCLSVKRASNLLLFYCLTALVIRTQMGICIFYN